MFILVKKMSFESLSLSLGVNGKSQNLELKNAKVYLKKARSSKIFTSLGNDK